VRRHTGNDHQHPVCKATSRKQSIWAHLFSDYVSPLNSSVYFQLSSVINYMAVCDSTAA